MSARTTALLAAALLAGALTACREDDALSQGTAMKLTLTSPAFADGQPIPDRHANDRQNISPALQWSGVPPSAKSLALVCDDPDAPAGTWVHWVLYNLPPETTNLDEGVPPLPDLPNGAKQGLNDFKGIGYGGPQPPPGKPHRYFFKLYALDVNPALKSGLSKADLLQAMNRHVLAEGQLMGTYQRK